MDDSKLTKLAALSDLSRYPLLLEHWQLLAEPTCRLRSVPRGSPGRAQAAVSNSEPDLAYSMFLDF